MTRITGVGLFLAVLLCGCQWAFYRVPYEIVIERAETPVEPFARSRRFETLAQLADAMEGLTPAIPGETKPSPPAGTELIGTFVHISDAQIRDELIYKGTRWQDDLMLIDQILPVTLRNAAVERYDTTIFAAYVVGFAKAYEGVPEDVFLVHTGDLLDISVVTEMCEVGQILRRTSLQFPEFEFFSLAGNHDGITFGTIPNEKSDMRRLGVNRSGFVMANLLFDPVPGRGFGFGRNEVVERFYSPDEVRVDLGSGEDWDMLEEIMDNLRWSAVKAEQIRALPDPHEVLRYPLLVSAATWTGPEWDEVGTIGYYSWTRPAHPEVKYVALDTRGRGHAGYMTRGQIGWLYNELADAVRDEQAVVLLAHHGPGELGGPNGRAFRKLLQSFPNIAGYFYGHGHVNLVTRLREREYAFPILQTGSIVDYPGAGREIDVWATPLQAGEREITFVWQFVLPQARTDTADGVVVQNVLRAVWIDAWTEFRAGPGSDTEGTIFDWPERNLQAGSTTTRIAFPAAPPAPEEFFSEHWISRANDFRRRLGVRQIGAVR